MNLNLKSLAAAAAMFLAPPALAADLSNNLTNATSGTEAATTTRWLAGSFTTDASAHVLNSVTLKLGNSIAGAATVQVYANGGLRPGTLVATLTSPAAYSAAPALTTFTTGGLTLSVNTTYWIVLRPTSGQFDWSWTSDNSGAGVGFTHTWGVSEDSGTNWWSQDIYQTQFGITVDSCTNPTINTAPGNATSCRGGSAAFGVGATGTGTLTYQWRKGSTILSNGTQASGAVVSGATTALMTISNAQVAEAGAYNCVVSNSCGPSASNSANLTVCIADIDDGNGTGNCDGGVTVDDLLFYLSMFSMGDVRADVDDGSGTGVTDGGVTIDDLLYFLGRFAAGC